VLKRRRRLARGENDTDSLSHEAPSDKRKRQGRRVIKPLSVIDNTQQGSFLADVREQTQHAQPDKKPIRGCADAQSEHDLERLALRDWKTAEPIEERRAQLVQTGESELHLGFHPRALDDGQIRRRADGVLEQGRLPDPSLASQHQHPAPAGSHVAEQRVESVALAAPTEQHIVV
jgi:hypothetical protein